MTIVQRCLSRYKHCPINKFSIGFSYRLIHHGLHGKLGAAVEAELLEHRAELLEPHRPPAGLPGHLPLQAGTLVNLPPRSGLRTLLQHHESLQSQAGQFVLLPCTSFPLRAAPHLPRAFQPHLPVAAGKAAGRASGTRVFY